MLTKEKNYCRLEFQAANIVECLRFSYKMTKKAITRKGFYDISKELLIKGGLLVLTFHLKATLGLWETEVDKRRQATLLALVHMVELAGE